jgi:hypothetical protein
MKVRLRKRFGLLAGMVALAGFASGCVEEAGGTELDPEGPPYVLQAFVLDPTSDDHSSPFVPPSLVLTYGVHRSINVCPFNVATGENDGTCAAPLTCDINAGSKTFRHCVDGSGKLPISTNAFAGTPFIRLVSKELLDGATLESFACACRGAGATACPAGGDWSASFTDCSVCGDAAATTTNESGECLDANGDDVPDLTSLNPGVVALTCGTLIPRRENVRGEGYYWPSGNQLPSSVLGWGGIGPAIVHAPRIELPTSTVCTVEVTAVPRDKDGNSFVPNPDFNEPITFRTEALAVADFDFGETETGTPVDVGELVLVFNVSLDEASVASGVTVTDSAGAAVDAEVALDPMDPTAVIITLADDLAAGEEYTVTVADTVADSFGVAFGMPEEFTFETQAAM